MHPSRPFRPFEISAVVLALPSLVFGAVVLLVTIWPPPGPGENGMAVVIPCGLASIGFFALFLVVALAARLCWRWFAALAGVWVSMCVAIYGMGEMESRRLSDPQPLLLTIDKRDLATSTNDRFLYFVADRAQTERYTKTGEIFPDVDLKYVCVVGNKSISCLVECLDRAGGSRDSSGFDIIIYRHGRIDRLGLSRAEVAARLEAMSKCVDGPARDRIEELKQTIATKLQAESK